MFSFEDNDDVRLNEHIYEKMHKQKTNAFETISLFVHPICLTLISKIIAVSFFEEQKDAMNIADLYDLSKMDFLAILEDFEIYKELYLKEMEKQSEQEHEYAI